MTTGGRLDVPLEVDMERGATLKTKAEVYTRVYR